MILTRTILPATVMYILKCRTVNYIIPDYSLLAPVESKYSMRWKNVQKLERVYNPDRETSMPRLPTSAFQIPTSIVRYSP